MRTTASKPSVVSATPQLLGSFVTEPEECSASPYAEHSTNTVLSAVQIRTPQQGFWLNNHQEGVSEQVPLVGPAVAQ
jgi:hypothetical protein